MAFEHAISHIGAKEAYWATQSYFEDTFVKNTGAIDIACNKVTCVWTRQTPAGTREDVCTITFALAKIIGGGLYGSLAPSEMSSLETDMDTLFSTLATKQDSDYTLSEYVWHEHSTGHPATDKGYEVVGPAVRRTSKSITGTQTTARQPDQISSTISFRTASRKHWGRVYFPGLSTGQNDGNFGRIQAATVDVLATNWRTFAVAAEAKSAKSGVYSWKKGSFLALSEIRVDNVWDIQRRRRAKQQSYFKSFTA